MDKPVYIFDLDGTLLTQNSFPLWVRYMLSGPFSFMFKAQVTWIMLRRKILCVDHGVTKRKLQKLWTDALAKDASQFALNEFLLQLKNLLRPNLQPLLQEVAAGQIDAVLATAAAGEYARPLAAALDFKHVISTPLCTEAAGENVGEQKRDNVVAFLKAQGWENRKRIFLTDHLEDLPMMRESNHVYWFGRENEVEHARKLLTATDITYCATLDAGHLQQLFTQVA